VPEPGFPTSREILSTKGKVILALGLFSPIIEGKTIERGMAGIVAAARANFLDKSDRIITIRSLSDFENDFKWLSDDLLENYGHGKFRGIASGFFVQEALEGGYGITDIHYDLTGVQNTKDSTHAGLELRSLIAHARAFHPRKVNIHFGTDRGSTTIGKDAISFEGLPFPSWLREHFPKSMCDEK
jgi:hypothetical protein